MGKWKKLNCTDIKFSLDGKDITYMVADVHFLIMEDIMDKQKIENDIKINCEVGNGELTINLKSDYAKTSLCLGYLRHGDDHMGRSYTLMSLGGDNKREFTQAEFDRLKVLMGKNEFRELLSDLPRQHGPSHKQTAVQIIMAIADFKTGVVVEGFPDNKAEIIMPAAKKEAPVAPQRETKVNPYIYFRK